MRLVSTIASMTSSSVNPDGRLTREPPLGETKGRALPCQGLPPKPPGPGRDRRNLAAGMELGLPQHIAQRLRQLRQRGQRGRLHSRQLGRRQVRQQRRILGRGGLDAPTAGVGSVYEEVFGLEIRTGAVLPCGHPDLNEMILATSYRCAPGVVDVVIFLEYEGYRIMLQGDPSRGVCPGGWARIAEIPIDFAAKPRLHLFIPGGVEGDIQRIAPIRHRDSLRIEGDPWDPLIREDLIVVELSPLRHEALEVEVATPPRRCLRGRPHPHEVRML